MTSFTVDSDDAYLLHGGFHQRCKSRCSGALIVLITVVARPSSTPPTVPNSVPESDVQPTKHTQKQKTVSPPLDPPARNTRKQIALRKCNILQQSASSSSKTLPQPEALPCPDIAPFFHSVIGRRVIVGVDYIHPDHIKLPDYNEESSIMSRIEAWDRRTFKELFQMKAYTTDHFVYNLTIKYDDCDIKS